MSARRRELEWRSSPPTAMSSPFANTRTKRRTAFTVLLFWLFAFVSGLANACLTEPVQTHLHRSAAPEELEVQALMVSPGHLGAVADHPGSSGAGQDACLKFCGDSAQALVKLTPGVSLLDLPIAPPWVFAWTTRQAAAVPTRPWQELPALRPGLPLRTRFSRLAL